MMCLMRDVNEREREVIVIKDDDDDEMNITCVVVVGKMIDIMMWCE